MPKNSRTEVALCGDSGSVGLAQMSELQMQHLSVVSNGGPTVSAGGRMRGKRWLQEVQLRDASQGLTVSPTSVSGPKTQPYPTAEHPLPPLLKGLHPCLGQGVSRRGRTLYFNRPFI